MTKIFFILILFSFVGCGSGFSVSENEIPGWLQNLPLESGKIYAIGISGPTRYADDGKRNASDEARKELAKSFSSRVVSIMLQYDNNRNSQMREVSQVAVNSSVTDFVIANSQIVSLWIDINGLVPNSERGSTYALAVIDANKAKNLVQSIQQ